MDGTAIAWAVLGENSLHFRMDLEIADTLSSRSARAARM
jgi:hypothetical protein